VLSAPPVPRATLGTGAAATDVAGRAAVGVALLDAAPGTAGVGVPINRGATSGVDALAETFALVRAERAHASTLAYSDSIMAAARSIRATPLSSPERRLIDAGERPASEISTTAGGKRLNFLAVAAGEGGVETLIYNGKRHDCDLAE
jgi:hypothetical protein